MLHLHFSKISNFECNNFSAQSDAIPPFELLIEDILSCRLVIEHHKLLINRACKCLLGGGRPLLTDSNSQTLQSQITFADTDRLDDNTVGRES